MLSDFYLEISALVITALLAAGMLLTVIGASQRRRYTYWFVLLVTFELVWTLVNLTVRFLLLSGFSVSDGLLEVSAVAFTFIAMSFFGFANRYSTDFDLKPRWFTLPATVFLAVFYVFIAPEGLVDAVNPPQVGFIRLIYHPLAWIWSVIPGAYLVGSLILLWHSRKNNPVRTFMIGGVFLTLGFLTMGLPISVPDMFVYFNLLGSFMLSYAVLRMQVFNPLVESSRVLAENETNLHQLLDTLFDMVVVCNDAGKILYCNQRFIEKVCSEGAPGVQYLDEYISPTYVELVHDLLKHDAGSESTFIQRLAQIKMRTLSNAVFDAEIQVMQGIWSNQPALYVMIHDMTEQLEAELEISRLQVLLENITMAMPSALIAINEHAEILTWNPKAVQLTGIQSEDAAFCTLWTLCPEMVVLRDLVQHVMVTEAVVQRNRQLLVMPTRKVYCDVAVFPLHMDDLKGVVLRLDDITDRVHLEEGMHQSAKMASVGRLAAGIAHEINNPLAAILQSIQVIQLALDPKSKRSRNRMEALGVTVEGLERYLAERRIQLYLDGIRESGTRAAKIVSDLLSFSRHSLSNFAPRDLKALTRQALSLAQTDYNLGANYDFRDIHVNLDFSDDDELIVICDGQQIQQVILNLVRNAAQAMAEKLQTDADFHPILDIALIDMGEIVQLSIANNGPEVPADIRQKLFEPFVTTKEVGSGTGLGLWLSWSIIHERHRGRIWLDHEVATGVKFVIELPKEGFQGADVQSNIS